MKQFMKRSLYITGQAITVLWLLACIGFVLTLAYFGILYLNGQSL